MERNQLIERYRAQIRIFRNHHQKITANPDMEDIHQLRIAVKRLRALLRLMETVCDSEFKQEEHLLLFSSLFKEAGKLREAQVNERLVNSSGIEFPQEYLDYLHDIQDSAGTRLQDEIRKFNFQKLRSLDNVLTKKIGPIAEQSILKYADTEVLHQMRIIQELRKKPYKRKKLHQVRMKLKIVMVLLDLILSSSQHSDLASLEGSCARLTKQLGKWHDLEVLTSSLREFSRQQSDRQILKKIRKATRIIRKEALKYRRRIVKMLVAELP